MILSSSIGKKLGMALTGLLLLIGIDMVLPATQAACRTTDDERSEAAT